MSEFFALPLVVVFIVSAVLIALALEAGRLLGRRARRRGGDNVTTMEAAILGLLALIIGFTVAISISRYDGRRAAILNEANSIGTVALRATLLPAPHGAAIIGLLGDYTSLRLHVTQSVDRPNELKQLVERSNEILDRLWAEAKGLASKSDAMVPTGIFIEALNNLNDDQEKRLSALHSRVPRIVLVALYGIAFVALGFVGYASGLEPNRRRLPAYVLALLIVSVILIIQDLDRPNAGFIMVSQEPLIDAAQSLDGMKSKAQDP